ncbi:MAG: SusC/RagA family TonB-linked outer membrane protein [Tannerellaceae bacterium]|nr:SusC/RagA family TonB-linked outer membrane protein [Tannerellaceae bacterium]
MYHYSIYTFNDTHTSVSQNMSKGHTMTWTNTAGYDWNINADQSLNALVGMEAIRYQGTSVGAGNWDLKPMFNDWQHAFVDNTENTSSDGKSLSGSPSNIYRRLSYFGRLSYNYKEKHLLNATLRADASSKFAKGHRWGYFPSVSAGWIVTAEDFASSVTDVLDYFKLRVSWGQVGNQNIDDFQYAAPIKTTTTNYIFGTPELGAEANQWGAYPDRLANANLKWETSEQTNIGFDAHLINKLSVNADFYIKTTKDWLVVAPILGTVGTGAPYINGGDVKNTGVELALNYNDRIGGLNYTVGVNGAWNKNVVGKIPTADPTQPGIIHGQTAMLYDNSEEFYRAEDGYAIGYFRGYQTCGIFQNAQEIAEWRAAGNGILQSGVRPGDVKYVDQNHDGMINDLDKTDLGNGLPDFTCGLSLGLEYKNFDFSVNATGMAGNEIVQSLRNHTNVKSNYTTSVLQRWTGEGTSNRIPRVTETNINWQFSDLYIHDGDFLRISNITLGYDFSKLADNKYVNQVRLYVQVQNAFTFTRYNGMDPEIGYGMDGWVSGVDLGYYPRPRTFLVGANIKF